MKTSRDDLLAIAFRLFLTKGYENTSMQDLARASGLSKGAFHHYFPRKQDLLDACIARFFHEFLPATDDAAHKSAEAFALRTAQRYADALILMRQHDIPLAAYQAFLWAQVRDAPQAFQQHQAVFARALATGFEAEYPGCDGMLLARHLIARIEGMGALLCLEPPADAAAIAPAFRQVVEDFLAPLRSAP
ncbi:MAG: TetR/AcrR family transcriptional regulator [Pararhodobacter sp.]